MIYHRIQTLLLFLGAAVFTMSLNQPSQAETVTLLDSPSQAQNTSTRQAWLDAIGISTPDHLVDFESGFTNVALEPGDPGYDPALAGPNIGGIAGLFPDGLILRSTTGDGNANRVKIKGRTNNPEFGEIKLSNPVGELGAMHTNDNAYFIMDFNASPVDYVGFQDIDHEGIAGQIVFASGFILDFDGIDETENTGDSAEFVGFIQTGGSRIAELRLESSGDSGWGVDNIEYGIVAVPEPGSFAVLALGTLVGFISTRRKRK